MTMNYARAVTGSHPADGGAPPPPRIRVALADSKGVIIHCSVDDVEPNAALRLVSGPSASRDAVILRECIHAHRGHCVFGAECRFVHFRNGAPPAAPQRLPLQPTASNRSPLPSAGAAPQPLAGASLHGAAVAEAALLPRPSDRERPPQQESRQQPSPQPPLQDTTTSAVPAAISTAPQPWSGHLLWPLHSPAGLAPPTVAATAPARSTETTQALPPRPHYTPYILPQPAPLRATPTMGNRTGRTEPPFGLPHYEPFRRSWDPSRFLPHRATMGESRSQIHDVAAILGDARATMMRLHAFGDGFHHSFPPAMANPFRSGGGGRVECSLCCELFPATSNVFVCSQRHAMCRECLSSYLTENWGTANPRERTSSDVRCAHPGCSSPALSIGDVIRHATPSAAEFYVQHRLRLREAECFAEAQELVAAKLPQATEVLDSLLQRQLRAHLVKAKQCPECGFGPVDFHGCDDLTYHHLEEREGGAHVDNSCPQCGFFALHVDEWSTWDGTFHTLKEQATGGQQKELRRERGGPGANAAAMAEARRGHHRDRDVIMATFMAAFVHGDVTGDDAAEDVQVPFRSVGAADQLAANMRTAQRGGGNATPQQPRYPTEGEITRALREMFPDIDGRRIVDLVRQRFLFYRQRRIRPLHDAVVGEIAEELLDEIEDDDDDDDGFTW